jgi:photosystem II stability/assembly factor-like uncharacterized protein
MRFEKIIFCLLYLLVIQIYAQRWETQNSGVAVTIRDVCFVDSLNGWAVGDSSTILSTSDGGRNWISKKYSTINYTFLKVQFVSRNLGYIIGVNGLIISTEDGGMNWNLITHGYDINFSDMCFISENEGYLAGYKTFPDHGIGLILHTTNRGNTFEKQLEIISNDQFSAKLFTAVKFSSDKVGWALAGDYVDNFSPTYIYRTNDGGKTWNIISQINSNQNKLRIAGNDTLWVGGTTYSYFATSFDGGFNWNINQNDNNYAISFFPESGLKGWICNYKLSSGNLKKILYTNDAGSSWKEELQLQQFVLGMSLIDEHLWIVGQQGLIMRRKSLINSVKKGIDIPTSFHLYQNYPNPFNNSTVIRFDLFRDSEVNISIYNYIGQLIKTYTFSSLMAGTHFVEWDGNNNKGKQMSSGFYICKMNVKNETRQEVNRPIKIIYLK